MSKGYTSQDMLHFMKCVLSLNRRSSPLSKDCTPQNALLLWKCILTNEANLSECLNTPRMSKEWEGE